MLGIDAAALEVAAAAEAPVHAPIEQGAVLLAPPPIIEEVEIQELLAGRVVHFNHQSGIGRLVGAIDRAVNFWTHNGQQLAEQVPPPPPAPAEPAEPVPADLSGFDAPHGEDIQVLHGAVPPPQKYAAAEPGRLRQPVPVTVDLRNKKKRDEDGGKPFWNPGGGDEGDDRPLTRGERGEARRGAWVPSELAAFLRIVRGFQAPTDVLRDHLFTAGWNFILSHDIRGWRKCELYNQLMQAVTAAMGPSHLIQAAAEYWSTNKTNTAMHVEADIAKGKLPALPRRIKLPFGNGGKGREIELPRIFGKKQRSLPVSLPKK